MPSAGQVKKYWTSWLTSSTNHLNTPLSLEPVAVWQQGSEQLVTMKQSFSAYRLVNFLKVVTVFILFVLFTFTAAFYRKYENNTDQCCQSTCGSVADARGPNQNIVSFSLFGNLTDPALSTRYVLPLRALVANISRAYPGKTNVQQ